MKIIELRAENFKRLSAVRIHPDGTLALITGRNAQGKSSVLDAVWAALGGKAAAPAKPVREGAHHALVEIDLGDITVKRRFTSDGKSTLVVESKDGLRHPSPQAVLDRLVGKLTFDPLAFSRMDEKQQATTLRDLAGLDTSALDEERATLFATRTAVNRDIKALEAQLAEFPALIKTNVPDEEASAASAAAQYTAAFNRYAENERARRTLREHELRLEAMKAEVDDLERVLAIKRKSVADMAAECTRWTERVEKLVDPDLEAIKKRMGDIEATNAAVRQKKAFQVKQAVYDKTIAAAQDLTDKLAAIDELKAATLAAAAFPVPGLSVDGDVVTFNGLPFAQASSAEQLRVGLAIGAALNPTLRVVLVRDGSLLDEDGLRFVAEWAEANGMQVIMERVDDGSRTGVVIEDGEVLIAPVAEARV